MKKFVDLGKIGNIDFYQTNQYIISLLSIFEANFRWYFGPYLGGGSGSNNYSTVRQVHYHSLRSRPVGVGRRSQGHAAVGAHGFHHPPPLSIPLSSPSLSLSLPPLSSSSLKAVLSAGGIPALYVQDQVGALRFARGFKKGACYLCGIFQQDQKSFRITKIPIQFIK